MELISPSKNRIQYTRIQIPPHMMNSDIEDNMNIVLQQKVEGKCNRFGFVEKVHNIEEYSLFETAKNILQYLTVFYLHILFICSKFFFLKVQYCNTF